MKKRVESVYSLPCPVYSPGSGFLVLSGEMVRRKKDGSLYCTLCIRSLLDQELEELTVLFDFFDEAGDLLGDSLPFSFSGVSLKRDELLGEKQEFPVPFEEAASFEARLHTLTENGEQYFFPPEDAVYIEGRIPLEDAFPDPEYAEQFRIRYGEDCRYLRSEEADLWFCVCGGINYENENNCHSCRRAKKALTNLNLDALRAEVNRRQKHEVPDAESGKAPRKKTEKTVKPEKTVRNKSAGSDPWEEENDAKPERTPLSRRRKKILLIVLIPLVLLLGLLLAAVPGALSREHRYRQAGTLLQNGDLDAAEAAYSEVSAYRDSADILAREIPYQRALVLMNAAERGDLNALTGTGHSRAELTDEITPVMLLSQAAAEAFEALGDYRDSTELAQRCRAAVSGEAQRMVSDDYNRALQLLEEGSYSEAAAAFRALGDYSDSQEMIRECTYRKALGLYEFLNAYDVSRLWASLSLEPGKDSVFSIPAGEAVRLGGDEFTNALRDACGRDPVDIRLEDSAPQGLANLRDALSSVFRDLGDYRDSASYPALIKDATDYTAEFYELCSAGELQAALNWLNAYEGDFPLRNEWRQMLELYLPYCGTWHLYSGDATLFAYTLGQNFRCNSVEAQVLLNRDAAAKLRLSFGEGNAYQVELSADPGETLFVATGYTTGNYMAAINNMGRLGYTCYNADWRTLSASEYTPAA